MGIYLGSIDYCGCFYSSFDTLCIDFSYKIDNSFPFCEMLMESDLLSTLLRGLSVKGTVYFCDLVEPPWEKRFIENDVASFHQIRKGSCRLEVSGSVEILEAGDLVFIKPKVEHTLRSLADDESSSVKSQTFLLCGYVGFEETVPKLVKESLPDVQVYRKQRLEQNRWIIGVLDHLSEEYLNSSLGSKMILTKLTEVLLIALFRESFDENRNNENMEVYRDPSITKALEVVHEEYVFPGTIEA